MDSVSQIALGASVAHLTLGTRLGRSALLLGAALGTLPDLDVLIPYDGAIENFTYHRSFSHSLFVLTLISFPIAWLCQQLMRAKQIPYFNWWLCCWLVLFTHPLLDGFTVYGTQLLWPLTVPPIAWGSVFIIDPLYTAPLLLGVFIAFRRDANRARPYVVGGLALSTAYLVWTLFSQNIVKQHVNDIVSSEGINAEEIIVAPFPFSMLWRVVIVTDTNYLEGFSSLLDNDATIDFDSYSNGKQECSDWTKHWPIERLEWFTKGAFALSVQDNQLIATDLRMGIEDDYVFEFEIAEWQNENWRAIRTRQRSINIDGPRMSLLFHRIYDQQIDLSPVSTQAREVPQNCQPPSSS